MSWLNNLKERGLIFDVTDPEIDKKLEKSAAFYVGIDPTAPYMQLGNLLSLIMISHLARAGFSPILLFGGATGSIGDPSGKSKERNLLEEETIQKNISQQSTDAKKILGRLGVSPSFVNNADWTKDVSIMSFLRDIGKYFTINYMIAKDSVKQRLEGEGISFTEFSYMLLQSFDFLHLFNHHGCKLQIGGSDQWGNMTAGLELIRKKTSGEAFALCWPLLTDAQGKKFGKSESGGTIWLNTAGTSPFKLYQFFLNLSDDDTKKFAPLLSMRPLSEISSIFQESALAPEKRIAQKKLGEEIVKLIHGDESFIEAQKATDVLFGEGSLSELSDEIVSDVFSDVPNTILQGSILDSSTLLDLFVHTKLSASKGDARRLIQQGGAYIQGERLSDGAMRLSESSYANKNVLILRAGKKQYALVKRG